MTTIIVLYRSDNPTPYDHAGAGELADGSRRRELVFIGTVLFDGKNRPVEISVTEVEDALVGSSLLATHKLDIGFLSKTVRLTDKRQNRTQP